MDGKHKVLPIRCSKTAAVHRGGSREYCDAVQSVDPRIGRTRILSGRTGDQPGASCLGESGVIGNATPSKVVLRGVPFGRTNAAADCCLRVPAAAGLSGT